VFGVYTIPPNGNNGNISAFSRTPVIASAFCPMTDGNQDTESIPFDNGSSSKPYSFSSPSSSSSSFFALSCSVDNILIFL